DLLGEPVARPGVGRPGSLHDFHGDPGAVRSLAEIHHALATLTDPGDNFVIPDPSGILGSQRTRHSTALSLHSTEHGRLRTASHRKPSGNERADRVDGRWNDRVPPSEPH